MSSGMFYHGISKISGLSAASAWDFHLKYGLPHLKTPGRGAFGVCRAIRLLHSFEGGDACMGRNVITMTGTTKAGMENLLKTCQAEVFV